MVRSRAFEAFRPYANPDEIYEQYKQSGLVYIQVDLEGIKPADRQDFIDEVFQPFVFEMMEDPEERVPEYYFVTTMEHLMVYNDVRYIVHDPANPPQEALGLEYMHVGPFMVRERRQGTVSGIVFVPENK